MNVAPVRLQVAMVRPPQALVNRGFADLHAEPDESSERVDQAHYGERLALLAHDGEWFYAQGPDHYFGWINEEHLDEVAPVDRRIVSVVAADVRNAPTDAAPVVDRLPVASPLAIQERSGDWLRVSSDGWVAFRDTVDVALLPNRFPRPGDLLRTAECFLGVPYLWGGTTIEGLDCSGFTQLVYRLNGVLLDRDADQQAMEGRAVTTTPPRRRSSSTRSRGPTAPWNVWSPKVRSGRGCTASRSISRTTGGRGRMSSSARSRTRAKTSWRAASALPRAWPSSPSCAGSCSPRWTHSVRSTGPWSSSTT